jgi:hypothetical protein
VRKHALLPWLQATLATIDIASGDAIASMLLLLARTTTEICTRVCALSVGRTVWLHEQMRSLLTALLATAGKSAMFYMLLFVLTNNLFF